jgi:O-antigen/teichoic acid export membrane protein
VITRLYSPATLGAFGIFAATFRILQQASGLGYDHAVVLPSTDRDASTLMRVALSIGLALSALLLIIVFPLQPSLARLLNFEASPALLLLLPVATFLGLLVNTQTQWLIRKQRFRQLTGAKITQSAAAALGKVLAGLSAPIAASLILASLVGQFLQAAVMHWTSPRAETDRSTERPARDAGASGLARQYRDFPAYRAPQLLLNASSQNLPLVMLAALFGPAVAGFYAIASRVLQLPPMLVGASVGKVLLPRLADAAHSGSSLRRLIARPTALLFLLGIVPFGALALFGPTLFELVFGTGWAEAGRYARWLSVWLIAAFPNSPVVHAIPLLDLQRAFLAYEIGFLLARLAAIVVAAWLFAEPLFAVASFACVGFLFNAALIATVIYRADRSRRADLTDPPSAC